MGGLNIKSKSEVEPSKSRSSSRKASDVALVGVSH